MRTRSLIARARLAALGVTTFACLLLLVAGAADAAVVRPFESSFGSFENVQAVAVDQASGDVFVYDNGGLGGDVYKFDAAGNPVDFTGSGSNVIHGVGTISYPAAQELAVSQAGAAKGDLFVANAATVEIYSADTGEKLGELVGEAPAVSGVGECGVAVDTAGDVYVGFEGGGGVNRYQPHGPVVEGKDWTGSLYGLGYESCEVAADSSGDAYALNYGAAQVTKYAASEFNETGAASKAGTTLSGSANTLSVDPGNGDVYLDGQAQVTQLDSSGSELLTFANSGSEPIAASFGLDEVANDGKAYVADDSRNRVDIFAPGANIPEPKVTIEPATGAETGEPTFHGTVNPEGHDTHWRFEYSLDGGKTWLTTPEQDAGPGTSPVAVQASPGDLHGQKITVRLEASNQGGTTTSTVTELETAARKCPNEQIREEQHSTYLPDCRAYEQVSPADKNGGDVMADSARTRAAADGEAVSFASLSGFGDAQGTSVASEYLAERQGAAGRWVTHAITPPIPAGTLSDISAFGGTFYVGGFSPDFERGVVSSGVPVTSEPDVEGVANLYLREHLRSAGASSYALLTACPKCRAEGVPLPRPSQNSGVKVAFYPYFAGASPDFGHVTFESLQALTVEAPAQLSSCGTTSLLSPPSPDFCSYRLYESEHGVVRLAGVLPNGEAADASFAGSGAYNLRYTTHVVSDGSDGHSRVFFTQPTNGEGKTVSELGPFGPREFDRALAGKLFMRVDHAQTVMLNRSERSEPSEFAPAEFLDASADGERVFFTTHQALTDDAVPGEEDIYMYDAAKPEPHHLTRVGAGQLLGISEDGHYAYIRPGHTLVLWHDGKVRTIAPLGSPPQADFDNSSWTQGFRHESRVTPDGKYLLFLSAGGSGYPPYDHGHCSEPARAQLGSCEELYVYSADENALMCASCDPSGVPGTAEVLDNTHEFVGGAVGVETYQDRVISSDGRLVFFTTAQALVPQDTNGTSDAYVFDTRTRQVALLSSGRDPSPSFFLDASADGRDAFIVTRQRLTGTDTDSAFDLYDVRFGGGFPEPLPGAPPCAGSDCRAGTAQAPALAAPATAAVSGSDNLAPPPAVSKPGLKPKGLSRLEELRAALRACRRKHGGKRKRCESQARRRYARLTRTHGGRR